MLAFEVRVFVISGTVAQWYFTPVGSSTQGTTLKALGHAASASFGTLCFGSLVRFPSPPYHLFDSQLYGPQVAFNWLFPYPIQPPYHPRTAISR
jgi:hypothetical protein